jgi:2-polyprenyl-3-methyl-5-hydroxy-6-metoxy-1,4-benzoquinol methylase
MSRSSTRTNPTADEALRLIVGAYDDTLVRAYCTVRFMILRQRFLFEIGQYLPPTGQVIDVGCGFGLFALYFATRFPALQIQGFDLSERRIETARRAAARLGVQNVTFHVGNAVDWRLDSPISAAYMLDLIHHIPEPSVEPLITTIASQLLPEGRLVIKDIEPVMSHKLAFTWLLDKVMDYKAPVRYWAPEEIQPLLESNGFDVHRHRMIDYLPYPHILYVGTRRRST